MLVAAYCVLRALEKSSSPWWLAGAGVALGVGFLAKMLQAFLVAPVFALVFLVCADLPWRNRVLRLLGGVAALVASTGWYLALVALWPAESRPYIGGSQNNSILELALGYNGLGRLTGDEIGGLGNMNRDVGWGRLLGGEMGGQIGWLLPAAVIAVLAGLFIAGQAPRTDPLRASVLAVGRLAGGHRGDVQLHERHRASLLHGGVGARGGGGSRHRCRPCSGSGARTFGRRSRCRESCSSQRRSVSFCCRETQTGCRGCGGPSWSSAWRRPAADRRRAWSASAATALGAVAVVAALAGPAAYSLATAATPHRGAIPSAGPGSGFGGPPGFLDASRPGAALTALLTENATDYTWVAAAVGSNNAAGYQLATGAPVMAVGGFNGTDPAPTLAQFQADVADGRIHYFVGGTMMRPRGDATGSDAAQQIADWVEANFVAQTVGSGSDAVTIYDVSE